LNGDEEKYIISKVKAIYFVEKMEFAGKYEFLWEIQGQIMSILYTSRMLVV
jgi:hypothetical protein